MALTAHLRLEVLIFKKPSVMQTKKTPNMAEAQYGGGRLAFPISGSELPRVLLLALEAETGIADRALNQALDNIVLKEFEAWFVIRPRELDQAMLKKIRNSASTAGTQGDRRTMDAMKSMDIWQTTNKKISAKEAALIIRLVTQELRRAKTYLFHQAKCIRVMANFVDSDEAPVQQVKKLRRDLESIEDFREWSQELRIMWREYSPMDMKNRLMVSNFWEPFVDTFVDETSSSTVSYSQTLNSKLKEFINPAEYVNLFEREILTSLSSDIFLRADSGNSSNGSSSPIQMDTKISGHIVTIIFRVENWSEAKVANAKLGLTFELSKESLFQVLDLAVTSTTGLHSEIRVSLNEPDSSRILGQVAEKALGYLSEAN